MDAWGIGIFAVSAILYFVSKKKTIFVFTAGIGLGILIGAIWAAMLINQTFRG